MHWDLDVLGQQFLTLVADELQVGLWLGPQPVIGVLHQRLRDEFPDIRLALFFTIFPHLFQVLSRLASKSTATR